MAPLSRSRRRARSRGALAGEGFVRRSASLPNTPTFPTIRHPCGERRSYAYSSSNAYCRCIDVRRPRPAARAVSAELKVEEQIVGPPYEQGVTYVLSPKGLHLATVHPKGSRFAVTVDGVQGPPFDEILKVALSELDRAFERGAGEMAPLEYLAFSPDGTRYANYASEGPLGSTLLVNGEAVAKAAAVAARSCSAPTASMWPRLPPPERRRRGDLCGR
jgi:hypothetical protein